MAHVYKGQWEWRSIGTDGLEGMGWYPPKGGYVGVLDLRGRGRSHTPGPNQDGYGLFAYDVPDSTIGVYLGEAPDDSLRTVLRGDLESSLELPRGTLVSTTLRDIVMELMTQHAALDGSRVGPIMPTSRGDVELWLPGFGVQRHRFDMILDPLVLQKERESYRKVRQMALDGLLGKRDPDGKFIPDELFHRRWLTTRMEKYRTKEWEAFVPDDLPKEEPEPHDTSQSDDFNRGDGGLGANWTDEQGTMAITSNEARSQAASTHYARYTGTNLSSDDHYGEVEISTHPTTAMSGAACRMKDETEMYRHGYRTSETNELAKIPFSQLGSANPSVTLPSTYRVKADGTTITATYDGGTEPFSPVTDSDTDTLFNAGMVAWGATTNSSFLDDFLAADLAVATVIPHIQYHYANQVGH